MNQVAYICSTGDLVNREVHMSTTQSTQKGVDVTELVETIGGIKQDPTLARFRFRATNLAGRRHSRTSIQGYLGVPATRIDARQASSPSTAMSHQACSAPSAPNAVEARVLGCSRVTL